MMNATISRPRKYLEVRSATAEDDPCVVARLLIGSDPYIFDFWFDGNEAEGIETLSRLIQTPRSLFYYQNIHVAVVCPSGEIIGALLAISPRSRLDCDYAWLRAVNGNYCYTVDHFIEPLVKGVEGDPLTTSSIIFLCVDERYRSRGVGSRFLESFLAIMEDQDYERFELCCLSDNQPALALYRKLDFYEIASDVAFVGDRIEFISTTILARDVNHCV